MVSGAPLPRALQDGGMWCSWCPCSHAACYSFSQTKVRCMCELHLQELHDTGASSRWLVCSKSSF